MDRYGGCFAKNSPVMRADGSQTEIQFLRPGMRVWGGASVLHVVCINYNATVNMVTLQASAGTPTPDSTPDYRNISSDSVPTLVTPWHPVCLAGEWTFPCRIATARPIYMDCVYNLVLSSGHVISMNGLEFITLGHGNDSHPVLAHAFFGTQVWGLRFAVWGLGFGVRGSEFGV